MASRSEKIKKVLTSYAREFYESVRMPRESVLRGLSLFGAFLIAVLLRAYVVLRYGVSLRAYDPFIQYYAAKYIEEHGFKAFLEADDFTRWYPWGMSLSSLYVGIPLVGAAIHLLLKALGFNVDLYTVVCLVPAIFGSLTVFPAYGLAKEFKSERAGLMAALLVATSPGVFQRSSPGFYDNEAIGIFLIILTLWLSVRAIKTGSVKTAAVAGIAMGILGMTWGVYRYVYDLLALFVALLVLSGKLDGKGAVGSSVTLTTGLALMLLVPRNYGSLTKLEVLAVLIAVFLVFAYSLASVVREKGFVTRPESFWRWVSVAAVLAMVGILILYAAGYLQGLEAKFASVLAPFLRKKLPTFSSVSENQPATWATIFVGAVYCWAAVAAIYFAMERRNPEDILLVLTVLTAFYFSASISRFIVVGAALMAVGAGVALDYLLDPFAKVARGEWIAHKVKDIRKRLGERKLHKGTALAVYILVFMILFGSAVHGIRVTQFYGGYDITDDEKYILDYLREHASPSDVVLSWWDYGYRLRVFGNVTTLVDNATGNSTQMGVVGAMLMLPENQSIRLMKRYNVKWIVVYGVDIQKAIWMIRIAEKHAPEFNITEEDYFDNSTGKYKEPFFRSLLWQLVIDGETTSTIDQLISWFGTEAVNDKKGEFDKVSLKYVVPVAKSPSSGGSAYAYLRWVKLYKVVYREDSTHNFVPLPPAPASSGSANVTGSSLRAASASTSEARGPCSTPLLTEARRFYI